MTDDLRVSQLQDLLWIINDVDQLIEHAMLHRVPVSEVIPKAMDRLLKYVKVDALTVRVPDEDGEVREFVRPAGVDVMHDQIASICERLRQVNSIWYENNGGIVFGQRLDLRVEFVGAIIAHRLTPLDEATRDHTQRALYHWSEAVDNYIATISEARLKQQALAAMSDAFKQTILEQALDDAIAAFAQFVEFDTLLLVCQSGEVVERSSYSYRFWIGGELEYSSGAPPDPRVEALVGAAVVRLLKQETVEDVLEDLHVGAPHLEDVPIYDFDGQRIAGRVIVGSTVPISRYNSDLIDRFADYLRQRVVDFSGEWRLLSQAFAKPAVERLLREPNYRARFLEAREESAAILYTDIAGFTQLCETVLIEPAKIGRLIERWSRHVVDIIWETGGMFDKIVGDCIIGLWGPPFFEKDSRSSCHAAADAARRIREYTAALTHDADFPELASASFEVGVATGLNYCRIYIGIFGPNDDFTAFGQGMNTTARLQGHAEINEILCMDSFVSAFGDEQKFGAERSASVTNVAAPIRFRSLQ